MNGHGGEDRLWLVSEREGSSLYFLSPALKWSLQTGIRILSLRLMLEKMKKTTQKSIFMGANATLLNFTSTSLPVLIGRTIEILSQKEINNTLQIKMPSILKQLDLQP